MSSAQYQGSDFSLKIHLDGKGKGGLHKFFAASPKQPKAKATATATVAASAAAAGGDEEAVVVAVRGAAAASCSPAPAASQPTASTARSSTSGTTSGGGTASATAAASAAAGGSSDGSNTGYRLVPCGSPVSTAATASLPIPLRAEGGSAALSLGRQGPQSQLSLLEGIESDRRISRQQLRVWVTCVPPALAPLIAVALPALPAQADGSVSPDEYMYGAAVSVAGTGRIARRLCTWRPSA